MAVLSKDRRQLAPNPGIAVTNVAGLAEAYRGGETSDLVIIACAPGDAGEVAGRVRGVLDATDAP